MDIRELVKVTSKAWSLHILALMQAGTPGRQASLLAASGAGRTAFAQSLSHLVELGYLERNPGHGHPLRPEFRLTPRGAEIARIADRINRVVPGASEHKLLRRAWSVPVLAVSQRPLYFTDIKTELASITDRALSQSLKQLQAQSWVSRRIDLSRGAPRPLYQVVNAGARISLAIRSAHPAPGPRT